MSVEKIRAAAQATKDTYLFVPATDLHAALAEVKADPKARGSLAEHVAGVVAQHERRKATDPDAPVPVLGVHRTVHLGPVLGEA